MLISPESHCIRWLELPCRFGSGFYSRCRPIPIVSKVLKPVRRILQAKSLLDPLDACSLNVLRHHCFLSSFDAQGL